MLSAPIYTHKFSDNLANCFSSDGTVKGCQNIKIIQNLLFFCIIYQNRFSMVSIKIMGNECFFSVDNVSNSVYKPEN